MLAIGVPSGAQASIGVLFALTYCRTVLADGRRLAGALGLYLAGFGAAALLEPAGAPMPPAQVFGTFAGLLISSYLMFFVQSTLLAREAALRAQNAELAAKETFLAAVLDNVADGVIACDPEGRLTVFNRASRQLHGLDGSAPAPTELPVDHGILHPVDGRPLPREEVPLIQALRGEHVRDREVLLSSPGAGERSVLASGQPLYDGDPTRPLGAVLTLRDVTEWRRAEAALADQSVHDPLTVWPTGCSSWTGSSTRSYAAHATQPR